MDWRWHDRSGKRGNGSLTSGRWILLLAVIGLVGSVCLGGRVQPAAAQPDSVRTEILQRKGYPPNHSPRGALWRSAVVPGWGQVYNRQYYKLPFVYAGLGGLGYYVWRVNDRYRLYQEAHLFKIEEERTPDEPNPYAEFERQYNTVTERLGGEVPSRTLRSIRDKFRRRRDLSIVGTGLFYALTMVDAYVSAHLLTFDVDELAVTVYPTGRLPMPPLPDPVPRPYVPPEMALGTMGPGVSVRVGFGGG